MYRVGTTTATTTTTTIKTERHATLRLKPADIVPVHTCNGHRIRVLPYRTRCCNTCSPLDSEMRVPCNHQKRACTSSPRTLHKLLFFRKLENRGDFGVAQKLKHQMCPAHVQNNSSMFSLVANVQFTHTHRLNLSPLHPQPPPPSNTHPPADSNRCAVQH